MIENAASWIGGGPVKSLTTASWLCYKINKETYTTQATTKQCTVLLLSEVLRAYVSLLPLQLSLHTNHHHNQNHFIITALYFFNHTTRSYC